MINRVRTAVYDLYLEYSWLCLWVIYGFCGQQESCNFKPLIESEVCLEFDNWYEASCHNSTSSHKSELDIYLEKPLVPWNKELNVLQWWQFNPKFPTLMKLARDLLAILMSTVALESAFSIGGRVLDQNSNCLTPKTEEALICAQNWLQIPQIASMY